MDDELCQLIYEEENENNSLEEMREYAKEMKRVLT
jgi:hypothetical protein